MHLILKKSEKMTIFLISIAISLFALVSLIICCAKYLVNNCHRQQRADSMRHAFKSPTHEYNKRHDFVYQDIGPFMYDDDFLEYNQKDDAVVLQMQYIGKN